MLLTSQAITSPVALQGSSPIVLNNGIFSSADIQANFTFGSGGATVSAWVQTTFDGGATWVDAANFSFTTASAIKVFNLNANTGVVAPITPTNGTLTANTAVAEMIGNRWRVLLTTTGTYSNTTLRIDIAPRGPFQ